MAPSQRLSSGHDAVVKREFLARQVRSQRETRSSEGRAASADGLARGDNLAMRNTRSNGVGETPARDPVHVKGGMCLASPTEECACCSTLITVPAIHEQRAGYDRRSRPRAAARPCVVTVWPDCRNARRTALGLGHDYSNQPDPTRS